MNTQILWFATRGAGIVSLLLFTAVVVLGVMTSVRWQSRQWPRFLTAEVHRSLALLSLVFLGLHVVTAVVDPFTSLGWISALVPFASSYRPLWLGLGVVSVDILVAVIVTSLLRARVGRRVWRAVHWTAYASWLLALAHGIGTGSDASAAWMVGIDAACIGAAVTAVAWRLLAGRPSADLPAVVAAIGRGSSREPGALR
jgi:predicted ferric reductase